MPPDTERFGNKTLRGCNVVVSTECYIESECFILPRSAPRARRNEREIHAAASTLGASGVLISRRESFSFDPSVADDKILSTRTPCLCVCVCVFPSEIVNKER